MGIEMSMNASAVGKAFDKLKTLLSGQVICDTFEKAAEEYFVKRIQDKATKLKIVETGAMRASVKQKLISLNVYDGFTLKIYTNIPYALYHEKGTGRFAEGGKSKRSASQMPWVYLDERKEKYFTTYGVKPRPFFYSTVFEQQRNFVKHLSAKLNEKLKYARWANAVS